MELSAERPVVRTGQELRGSSIISALKAARIEYVLSVPDIVTSRGLLFPIAKDPAFRLIRVCKEDECLGIAAGLSYGNKRAAILIQQTGLFYAMNAIRGVGVELNQPICLMVGLLGREPDKPPRQSRSYGVRIVEPVLDAMGIGHHLIESEADVAKIGPAIDECYEKSFPVALLIGRSPS
jgi:sulfopyruvate decarboxylase subunit alpha